MPGPVLLSDDLVFPPPSWATREGLIAVGGDLRPERLVLAYRSGIFPWPHEGLPLLWFCPDPRMILRPRELHIARSLRKHIRKRTMRVTLDRDFRAVMRSCATVTRSHEQGTWINQDMIDAYCRLHDAGIAHSVEVWQQDQLVGGLYGVSLGAAFFGESMFAKATNASKVGFVSLVRQLEAWRFHFVDCQLYTPHLERFGANTWPREAFIEALGIAVKQPTRRGKWTLELTADDW